MATDPGIGPRLTTLYDITEGQQHELAQKDVNHQKDES